MKKRNLDHSEKNGPSGYVTIDFLQDVKHAKNLVTTIEQTRLAEHFDDAGELHIGSQKLPRYFVGYIWEHDAQASETIGILAQYRFYFGIKFCNVRVQNLRQYNSLFPEGTVNFKLGIEANWTEYLDSCGMPEAKLSSLIADLSMGRSNRWDPRHHELCFLMDTHFSKFDDWKAVFGSAEGTNRGVSTIIDDYYARLTSKGKLVTFFSEDGFSRLSETWEIYPKTT